MTIFRKLARFIYYKNPGIHPSYYFYGFPSKMKILKLLRIHLKL